MLAGYDGLEGLSLSGVYKLRRGENPSPVLTFYLIFYKFHSEED